MEMEIEWAKMGANLILHSGDINRFSQIMHDDIRLLRAALNDQVQNSSIDINI